MTLPLGDALQKLLPDMSARRSIAGQGGLLAVALLIVVVASGLRLLFFSDLGRGTAYLTYYPAVVLAALLGGLQAGFLATFVSALLCFFWIQRGFMSHVETLAMCAFILSCCMISGVTEAMHRAQAKANREKEKAETANRGKSLFLARMSHELRTPLNAIIGFTSVLLSDDELSAEQHQDLEIINRSGEYLLSMINDVLDMAKIDADRMRLEYSIFHLGELVRDVDDLMRIRASAKKLQFIVHASVSCQVGIHADITKLRQILVNLVGNAIKFTDHGGVALRLDCRPANPATSLQLVIEVEDSGIGIPAEDIEQIFEPFVQASVRTEQKGTGLGLAITRKIVDLMGGHISVTSTLGKGSLFRVEVPVGQAQIPGANVSQRKAGAVGIAPGQTDFRILIVEDQIENLILLQKILEYVGFKVRCAQNGQESIELFKQWRPQFIWMDIRMPVMDGMEATRRIRKLEGGQDVRIVALTASAFKDEIDSILSAGMNALVRKPYHQMEIYECMARLLGVEFTYESDRNELAVSTPHLSATDLPDTVQNELRDALITLDQASIAACIARVATHDKVLAGVMSRLADNYDFSAILQMLNKEGQT